MTHAARTEEAAARWLLRRSQDRWSDADQLALDAWLEESAEHKVAYWRMEMGWETLGRMAALRAPSPPVPENDGGAVRRWWPMAAAASVTLVLAPVAWLATHPAGNAPTVYATNIGGREDVPLADGSKVELNTQTQLRASLSGNRRQVWLDHGEAYFEVAHDARRPFVIHAGPKQVTVLGTKFSVRRDGDRVQVAVVEGRVRVEDAAPSSRFSRPIPVLTRGDIAVAQGGSIMLAPKSVEEVNDDLTWRGGMLTFDQITLGDAASEFNRYNRKQLQVSDDASTIRIGGSFEAGNIEVFARLLQRTYGLKIDDRGNTIKISQ